MKKLLAFIPALLMSTIALAQVIPQRAQEVSAQGSAAATVTCAIPTPSPNAFPLMHLTGFTAMCGKASGSTTEQAITITGLAGSGTMTFYIDQTTTSPTFVAEDFTYPLLEAQPSSVPTPIVLTIPGVANGGPCSCVMSYVQY